MKMKQKSSSCCGGHRTFFIRSLLILIALSLSLILLISGTQVVAPSSSSAFFGLIQIDLRKGVSDVHSNEGKGGDTTLAGRGANVVGKMNEFDRNNALIPLLIACYKRGRHEGVNYYFDVDAIDDQKDDQNDNQKDDQKEDDLQQQSASFGACVPLPKMLSSDPNNNIPPADITAMTTLEAIDRMRKLDHIRAKRRKKRRKDQSDKNVVMLANASSDSDSVDSIIEKRYPSIHMRWQFNDWRLWEGELGCDRHHDADEVAVNRDEDDSAATQLSPPSPSSDPRFDRPIVHKPHTAPLTSFQTKGSHRPENLNGLYQLDNLCFNEEDGELIVFSATDPATTSNVQIDGFRGLTEHPYMETYHPANGFLLNNRVKGRGAIQLFADGPQTEEMERHQTKQHTFRSIITSSLNRYYNDAGKKKDGKVAHHPNEIPEVFFVEEPALVHPLNSGEEENPGHNFHRIATSAGLKNIIGAKSMLFLWETFAHHFLFPFCSVVCRTQLFYHPGYFTLPVSEIDTMAFAVPPHSSKREKTSFFSLFSAVETTSKERPLSERPLPDVIAILLAIPPKLRRAKENERVDNYFMKEEKKENQKSKIRESTWKMILNFREALLQRPTVANLSEALSMLAKVKHDAAKIITDNDAVPSPSEAERARRLMDVAETRVKNIWTALTGFNNFPLMHEFWILDRPFIKIDRHTGVSMIDNAVYEALGTHFYEQSVRTEYAMLLSSGNDDCEDYRCREGAAAHDAVFDGVDKTDAVMKKKKDGDDKTRKGKRDRRHSICSADGLRDHKRCATPYATLAVSSGAHKHFLNISARLLQMEEVEPQMKIPLLNLIKGHLLPSENMINKRDDISTATNAAGEYDFNFGVDISQTTYNYSRAVWNNAVRLTQRDAMRFRKDVITMRARIAAEKRVAEKRKKNKKGASNNKNEIGEEDEALSFFRSHDLAIDEQIAFLNRYSTTYQRKKNHVDKDGGEADSEAIERISREDPEELVESILISTPVAALARTAPMLHFCVNGDSGAKRAAHPYTYIFIYRRRVVKGIAEESISQDEIRAFYAELFVALLETLHAKEAHEKENPHLKRQRPQLMCYRTAYFTQIRLSETTGWNNSVQFRGMLNCIAPANCYTRELLNKTYGTVWQRFGQCTATAKEERKRGDHHDTDNALLPLEIKNSRDDGKTRAMKLANPQHDTNRDAHPIFVLPATEQSQLQSLFYWTRDQINRKVMTNDNVDKLKHLLETVRKLEKMGADPNSQQFRKTRQEFKAAVIFLTTQIHAIQKQYDDAFMRYFKRSHGAKSYNQDMHSNSHPFSSSTSSSSSSKANKLESDIPPLFPQQTPGRPIKLYQMHRSARRAFTRFRQLFTRLTADTTRATKTRGESAEDGVGGYRIKDFVDFEIAEGFAPDAYPLQARDNKAREQKKRTNIARSVKTENGEEEDLSQLQRSEALFTPRSRQYGAILSADLFIGAHGGDMHAIALAKPSAFTVELQNQDLDAGFQINSGYFAPFAFARNIGYHRVFMHRVENEPDPIAERRVGRSWTRAFDGQVLLSSTDTRQLYAVTVCSWLATNSVRLRDEDVPAGQNKAASTRRGANQSSHNAHDDSNDELATDYNHLVPWWCRGGPSPIVQTLLDRLTNRADKALEYAQNAVITPLTNNTERQRARENQKVPDFAAYQKLSAYHPTYIPHSHVKSTHFFFRSEFGGDVGSSGNGSSDKRSSGGQQQQHINATTKGNAFLSQASPLSYKIAASAEAAVNPNYYTVRGIPSAYGFDEPHCAPYFTVTMSVEATTGNGSSSSQSSTSSSSSSSPLFTIAVANITYNSLIKSQSICAVGITKGTVGNAAFYRVRGFGRHAVRAEDRKVEIHRTYAEGLQTLLESVFLNASPRQCQLIARLMMSGADNELALVAEDAELVPSVVAAGSRRNSDGVGGEEAALLGGRGLAEAANFSTGQRSTRSVNERKQWGEGKSTSIDAFFLTRRNLARGKPERLADEDFEGMHPLYSSHPSSSLCGAGVLSLSRSMFYSQWSNRQGDDNLQAQSRACLIAMLTVLTSPIKRKRRAAQDVASSNLYHHNNIEISATLEDFEREMILNEIARENNSTIIMMGGKSYSPSPSSSTNIVSGDDAGVPVGIHASNNPFGTAPRFSVVKMAPRMKDALSNELLAPSSIFGKFVANAGNNNNRNPKDINKDVMAASEVRRHAIEWIANQFFRVEGRPTWFDSPRPMMGTEFAYGFDCNRWMPGFVEGPEFVD